MKKVLVVVATIILVLILGIGGKIYMDKQAEKEEILKAIAKDKEQIEEIVRWNFKDVKSVTFEWVKTEKDGSVPVSLDKCLTTTPMNMGLTIHWYVNGNKDDSYYIDLDLGKNGDVFDKLVYNGQDIHYAEENMFIKRLKIANSEKIESLLSEVQDSNREFISEYIDSLILGISDIKILKSRGMTETITTQQIIDYWEEELNG